MTPVTADAAAPSVELQLEPYRRELTGFCYRMLGSGSEAEDAVQETMLRAWRASGSFEGRSSLRSWLYRIASNVCIDMGRSPQRRARPVDLGPARTPDAAHLADVRPEATWITPIADAAVVPETADPAEVAAHRESIRLAFVSALQQLPPRQRAALILCEVLQWQASEVAELLDTSIAAVNSALQRGRASLAAAREAGGPVELSAEQLRLLERYVAAFERYDIDELVTLLHADAVQTMPPFAMWLQGVDDVVAWWTGPGAECRGSRLIATWANGCPAFAQYRADPAGGHRPWALQVLELRGERIAAVHSFLGEDGFARFGLPLHLP